MKTIVFLDNTYPHPYQLNTLQKQGIGGTESSIIKTALILSKHYKVYVAQKHRKTRAYENDCLSFIPKKDISLLNPDYIIVIRKYPLLKILKKQFPKARLYLWNHTYKNTEYAFKRLGLSKTNTTVICNSDTHCKNTFRLLNSTLLGKLFSLFSKPAQVTYCYNPVNKTHQIKSLRDKNKLLFLSSPNKGLEQIVRCFTTINKELPNLQLYIANPGYRDDLQINNNKNITILGSLPHKQMMQHMSDCLCVFYPQDSFAETFGLIYAEANAYGTPVLAHDIGSAREILDNNNILVDANDYDKIIKLIKAWQTNYPVINYNQKLSDKVILKQWQEIL